MKKPRTRQSNGVTEQLSFLPTPAFSPIFPNLNSGARTALEALASAQSITQIDWLMAGHGWRLAAAIMDLNYLGWEIQSQRIHHPTRNKPIAVYSLSPKARRVAKRLNRGLI